jgi:hypothetical protein
LPVALSRRGFLMSAQYDPNKQGWGFASVVVLLTCGLLYTAYSIHERTYVQPRDPMMQQAYHSVDVAKAAEKHGEAKGEAKGEMKTEPKAEVKPDAEKK